MTPDVRALSVRPYRMSDRTDCAALFQTNVPAFFHDSELPDFLAFLDTASVQYFVVMEDVEIVGCGGYSLSDDGKAARLCWGMVRRERHAQGIGAYLLAVRLDAIVNTTRAERVGLATSQHTQGFYRRFGFEVQTVRQDGLAPGLDEVEMWAVLTRKTHQPR